MRRTPVSNDAAMADGVDLLLRRFRGLGLEMPVSPAAVRPSTKTPIEVTYLVASIDARPEIRAVADFRCSGVNDEIEINAGFVAAKAAGKSCKVQMSSGGFHTADGIVCDAGGGYGFGGGSSWLEGAGIGITTIFYDDGDWPAGTSPIEVVDWHGRASNFSIMPESECN